MGSKSDLTNEKYLITSEFAKVKSLLEIVKNE